MKTSPDIILAFAFSLSSDGSPGSYNERLAGQLHQYLEENQSDDLPLIALQWEIADALHSHYPSLVSSLDNQQKLFVVEPPRFEVSEFDEAQIESWFEINLGEADQTLADCLTLIGGSSTLARLNKFLESDILYKKFLNIDFGNLVRPNLGEGFTEHREIPLESNYTNGLKPYQRLRVNRLIIETIIHDRDILEAGKYLSTPSVIDTLLKHCLTTNHTFENILLVAHPLHLPRCIKQTNDAFTARKLETNITGQLTGDDFPWDSSSAQVWCRSLANWQHYESIVQEWINKNRP
jgi:hypothetical protein